MNFKALALTALAATTFVAAPAQAFWGTNNTFTYDDQYGGGQVVVDGATYTWNYTNPEGEADQFKTEILGCVALPNDGDNRVLECTEQSDTGIYTVGVYIDDNSVAFLVKEDGGYETTTIKGTNTFAF